MNRQDKYDIMTYCKINKLVISKLLNIEYCNNSIVNRTNTEISSFKKALNILQRKGFIFSYTILHDKINKKYRFKINWLCSSDINVSPKVITPSFNKINAYKEHIPGIPKQYNEAVLFKPGKITIKDRSFIPLVIQYPVKFKQKIKIKYMQYKDTFKRDYLDRAWYPLCYLDGTPFFVYYEHILRR